MKKPEASDYNVQYYRFIPAGDFDQHLGFFESDVQSDVGKVFGGPVKAGLGNDLAESDIIDLCSG